MRVSRQFNRALRLWRKTALLAVTGLLLLGPPVNSEDEPVPEKDKPKAPAEQTFAVENFSVKAAEGELIAWKRDPKRKQENERVSLALNGVNLVNALIVRHPEKRDEDAYGVGGKDGSLPKPGVQWAEFGRMSVERETSGRDDRRAYFKDWLRGIKRNGARSSSPGAYYVDRKRLDEQVWKDDADTPYTLFWGQQKGVGYWDLKEGEQIEYDEKTGKMTGWKERDDLECLMLSALYFHDLGIYHANAWGFLIKGEGKKQLETDLLALLGSFELKKSTTFEEDAGVDFEYETEWKKYVQGTRKTLVLPSKGRRDFRQTGPPATQIGYLLECRIDPIGGPHIQGATIEEVIEQFRAGFAKTEREKDTMNFIRSSRIDKKSKKIKVGNKKRGTLIEGRALKGKYAWTTKHQTERAGKFFVVKESISLLLTVVPTKRGQLLILTHARSQDSAAAQAMHKAILRALVISESNLVEEVPEEK